MANNPASTLGQAVSGYTPVVDYTPEKQSPSFSGPINEVANVVTYTGTANTLTPTDILRKLIILNNAGAITAVLPPSSTLIPAIEGAKGGLALGLTAVAGTSIEFDIKASGAGAVTVSVGTGGTLVGTGAITAGNVKRFRLVTTNAGSSNPAYTLYSLGQSAQ